MLWQSHAFKEFQEIQDATKLPFNDSPDRTKGGGAASTFLAMETKRNAKLLKAKSVSALDYKYEKMYTWLDFEKALGPYILGNSYRTANDTKMLIEKQFSISGTNNGTQVAQKSSDNEAKLFKMHWPSPAQWYQLNQLRIHAGTPERSMEGISKLLHYYCQLVHLEKKFPFDTAMNVSFMWFESFHHGRHSRSTCIQYEKACTVYNIAAIYAQLGVLEQPWTEKGKKTAAAYFQNAAGILVFLRDSICPRFKFKVSHESDLNELNLTALTTIMLAQAAECFYDKANDGI